MGQICVQNGANFTWASIILYGVFSCKFIELKIMAILGDCPVIFGRFFIVLGSICVQKGANFMLAPTA